MFLIEATKLTYRQGQITFDLFPLLFQHFLALFPPHRQPMSGRNHIQIGQ